MNIKDRVFNQTEKYVYPSTILFRSIEFKFLLKKIKKYVNLRPVIDLGCGDGVAGRTVLRRKIEYGLDVDGDTVVEARKSKVYEKVLLASADKIPLPDKSIKLVFSNSSIEHMFNLKSVLSEVERITKKGGCFIFTVPTGNLKKYSIFSFLGMAGIAKIYGKMRDKRLNHFHCYSLKQWEKMLKKYGFSVVDSCYYLDKKEIEYWDLLSIVHKLTLMVRKFSPEFLWWIYTVFLKEKIYRFYQESRVLSCEGSAICVVAKKT
jgi:SAM-dependent methyltransferase